MSETLFPSKFSEYMEQRMGSEFPDFVAAHSEKPAVSVRKNPFKPSNAFEGAEVIPWCPGAFFLPERPRFIFDPLIHAGAYYVQEASSMLLYKALQFKPGMKVLDLCASPGGKSTLISSFLDDDSLLVSNEMVGSRAIVLRENLSRWGKANVVITCNKPEDFATLGNYFDAVVVDAPCSGEGMFRKDPDTAKHWSLKAVEHCSVRQKDILESAIACLKPGGQLIYSTCTYNESEDEAIVQYLLDHHPGAFEISDLRLPAEWKTSDGITNNFSPHISKSQHCFPHRFKGEGFFICALKKREETRSVHSRHREGTKISPEKFNADEWLKNASEFSFIRLKDKISALPHPVSSEIGMLAKHFMLVKAGITVGEQAGSKFIPDHDLAMSVDASSDIQRFELSPEDSLKFLRREEIKPVTQGYKGWALVTYQGLAIGWIKALGNRCNGHLPKELKIRID